ncbi:hypothetical protein GF336_03760 [Candidatus Woesearchaeota archaeon]|nr:hypothetical protein [Candidatus Woesearchaeota archaeon]
MKIKEAYIQDKHYSKKEFDNFIASLVEKIIEKYDKNKTSIIGIQGGQGTGKTTLVKYLKNILDKLNYSSISFSIDDFYKSYDERTSLAKKFKDNPFYQIARGMPGTHRIEYLSEVFDKIKKGEKFKIPIFDKSLHDAAGDISGEVKAEKRPDFVFFEGWILGMPCIEPKELLKICRNHDVDTSWFDVSDLKDMMNFCSGYERLWDYLDMFIVLKAEELELHYKWRYEQEVSLKKKKGKGMSKEEVYDFVKHYIPITLLIYQKAKPDLKLKIDKKHEFFEIVDYKNK